MGDLRKIDNATKISELKIGDFIVFQNEEPTPAETKAACEALAEMPVPGVRDWMHEIPRRWFN